MATDLSCPHCGRRLGKPDVGSWNCPRCQGALPRKVRAGLNLLRFSPTADPNDGLPLFSLLFAGIASGLGLCVLLMYGLQVWLRSLGWVIKPGMFWIAFYLCFGLMLPSALISLYLGTSALLRANHNRPYAMLAVILSPSLVVFWVIGLVLLTR